MSKKSTFGMASWLLIGTALSGCQSSESWRSQGPSRFPNAGVTPLSAANSPNSSAATRPLGTNPAMNNQAGMSPSAMGIQSAGGAAASANATGMAGTPGGFNAVGPTNSPANSKPLNYSDGSPSSSVNSRQTDLTAPALPSTRTSGLDQGKATGADPNPPAPPSFSSNTDQGYNLPPAKPFSPPANSEVKTRVPGDDN